MTGLVLKLGPKERVLVNGVVIENGDRRSRMNILTPNAKILRLRDALHPNEANTPFRRVCYVLQLILTGDVEDSEGKKQVLLGLNQLSQAMVNTPTHDEILAAIRLVEGDKTYAALRLMRSLLPNEEQLLRA